MRLLTPMRLLRIPEPFDHPDFIFEPKLDAFTPHTREAEELKGTKKR